LYFSVIENRTFRLGCQFREKRLAKAAKGWDFIRIVTNVGLLDYAHQLVLKVSWVSKWVFYFRIGLKFKLVNKAF